MSNSFIVRLLRDKFQPLQKTQRWLELIVWNCFASEWKWIVDLTKLIDSFTAKWANQCTTKQQWTEKRKEVGREKMLSPHEKCHCTTQRKDKIIYFNDTFFGFDKPTRYTQNEKKVRLQTKESLCKHKQHEVAEIRYDATTGQKKKWCKGVKKATIDGQNWMQ